MKALSTLLISAGATQIVLQGLMWAIGLRSSLPGHVLLAGGFVALAAGLTVRRRCARA